MSMRRWPDACADGALRDVILLGLHHEQQHQELILTDIKHAFFSNPLLPAYQPRIPPAHPAMSADGISIPGGVALIGHDGSGFAFDNESPRHQVLLRPFRIGARPVSNGEYRAFIEDGGYRRPEFWLSDGWQQVQDEGWEAPLYWLQDDDGSARKNSDVFTLSGVRPLDPNAPVEHVSFFEAVAYAAWAKARLPTEFEWEAAAAMIRHDSQVWEWTRSAYDPYPGFKPFDGVAAEYNGKFMVGQMVLRGGSSATPPGHIRSTYRNFFPPQARWQLQRHTTGRGYLMDVAQLARTAHAPAHRGGFADCLLTGLRKAPRKSPASISMTRRAQSCSTGFANCRNITRPAPRPCC